MRIPLLASFIIIIIVLQFFIRRGRKKTQDQDKEFWARENEANNVRRKPLDDLEYINIPLDTLPMSTFTEDETVSDCIKAITELSDQQIVNLTGKTNTDLKLQYGVANLPFLSSCDDRFTTLVQTLQKWADRLWEKGYQDEAVIIMEYEVRIKADIGAAYRKLAKYYKTHGMEDKIDGLIEVAESLETATKQSIVRSLKEL